MQPADFSLRQRHLVLSEKMDTDAYLIAIAILFT